MEFEPVIGLEVHAELRTHSKMFCSCAVVDSTSAAPNTAVCPVCSAMPGALPVLNRTAVEFGIRVALALECEIQNTSIFARKNYFYPDLPKGYQISQYERPLAINGKLVIRISDGQQAIRVRRVHLEEDTGKLTHIERAGQSYSLVDLNRAGVPLLEIVSEPDLHSAQAARGYGESLRDILRYLGVNSGDMEKGVIRFEANVSVREKGKQELGTRTEVKNLNSFRALERAIEYEIVRQSRLIEAGGAVEQETLGWNEARGETYPQRSKEDAHDYRYFPEPDLPPLVVENDWIEKIRRDLPELPRARYLRFIKDYGLTEYDAARLTEESEVAGYFESALKSLPTNIPPKTIANWMLGDLFSLMNQANLTVSRLKVKPEALAGLAQLVFDGQINQSSARAVLEEMFASGQEARAIMEARGLKQVSDESLISNVVKGILAENPKEVQSYKAGKAGVVNFLFGQVMKKAAGKANPQVVRAELEKQLKD
ncbi:MAG TPA: Asp-tRNA(Asn)/Glu-tRNA(Gln) amidotransferase subunit GatB [Anaerolineales bacterium]|nr:Asp-tRNA(Asn)/Glu-tRNA(Gln) amidotransferase subunit GatB [Anaerolineales bacterium]